MALDLRLLRAFVTLAEEAHFGRAAERLPLSQPALSRQIRRLETQVGAALFVRDSRNVELTEAGAAMLEPARAALKAGDQAENAVRAVALSAARTVRVGLEIDLEHGLSTLEAFAAAQPQSRLWTSRHHEPEGHAALIDGQLDAFLGWIPVTGEDVASVRGADVEIFAVLHPEHPLASRASISLREFRASPVAIFRSEEGPDSYAAFVAMFSEGAGPDTLDLVEVTSSTASQRAMLMEVEKGNAVSFVTSAHMTEVRGLQVVHFDEPLTLQTYISWRRTAGDVVHGLVDHVRVDAYSARSPDDEP